MAGRTEIVEVRICLRERAASRDATVLGTLLFALQYNTAFSKQYRSLKMHPKPLENFIVAFLFELHSNERGSTGCLGVNCGQTQLSLYHVAHVTKSSEAGLVI